MFYRYLFYGQLLGEKPGSIYSILLIVTIFRERTKIGGIGEGSNQRAQKQAKINPANLHITLLHKMSLTPYIDLTV